MNEIARTSCEARAARYLYWNWLKLNPDVKVVGILFLDSDAWAAV